LTMMGGTWSASPAIGGRRHYQRITLVVIGGELDDNERNLVSLTSHCLGSRNGVASSKWRRKNLEGKSDK
jgi:hypothetical protein